MSGCPVQHWDLGVGPINCHAWNKDRSQIAVSTSDCEIYIFEWTKGSWVNIHVLKEHDFPVTGIDWAPNSNRIVSCSQDKNAYVWTFEGNQWKPELVFIRLSRAATCVKWSPLENKFAVGSGSKLVAICYYEKENNWWIAKHIKKPIKSTVKCIDWHPDNVLIAIGSCDLKARVFSAYIKEVDEKPSPNPWGSKMPLGTLLCEQAVKGWVNHISFSPSGCRLAWVAHDASIGFIDANVDNNTAQIVRTPNLPFTSIKWITENSAIAGGHDCYPTLVTVKDGKLVIVCKLDIPAAEKSKVSNTALELFKSIDKRSALEHANIKLNTMHQNFITEIQPHSGSSQNILKFSTCSVDGQVALWDLKNNTAVIH
ncbi:unnamed protein product, partial [Mesorhabditis belari]|uniref:Actin-related protein 2/3 complex subunit n=1 Tax=Mesorhabditis belari TaxID=2138241 RepID=A0AAF3J1X1_9BILA